MEICGESASSPVCTLLYMAMGADEVGQKFPGLSHHHQVKIKDVAGRIDIFPVQRGFDDKGPGDIPVQSQAFSIRRNHRIENSTVRAALPEEASRAVGLEIMAHQAAEHRAECTPKGNAFIYPRQPNGLPGLKA